MCFISCPPYIPLSLRVFACVHVKMPQCISNCRHCVNDLPCTDKWIVVCLFCAEILSSWDNPLNCPCSWMAGLIMPGRSICRWIFCMLSSISQKKAITQQGNSELKLALWTKGHVHWEPSGKNRRPTLGERNKIISASRKIKPNGHFIFLRRHYEIIDH